MCLIDIVIHEVEGGLVARPDSTRRALDDDMGAAAQLQHCIIGTLGDLAHAERGEPAGGGGNVAHADRDVADGDGRTRIAAPWHRRSIARNHY
jgi:hypothetical protein